MPATLTLLHDEIAREERIVGLPTNRPLTSAAIVRRHVQIGVLLGLVSLATIATLASTMASLRLWTSAGAIAFGVYAIQKERHLQRLSLLQVHECSINLTVADGLLRSGALQADGDLLDLRNAVERGAGNIAAGLATVLPADCSRVRLVGPSGETPIAAASHSAAATLVNDVSAAPEVVEQHESIRRGTRDGRTLLAVPMTHRHGVVGVLEVISGPATHYSASDLELVDAFARGAVSGLLTRRRAFLTS